MAQLEGRARSIGTLTGWQLLADQVVNAAAGKDGPTTIGSAGSGARTMSGLSGAAAPPVRESSLGATSEASTTDSAPSAAGSGTGSAVNMVVTRPHQWLYKEYKLLEEIGSGGFGRVCKARRLVDGRMVVVKEIKTTALTPKQKAATMDEVEVLAKMDHPNIVHYHDCFMDEVYINIVMEYCDGGDLTRLIKGRKEKGELLSEDDIMDKFVQVCLALQCVHAKGILHRDLKPSNVLVTSGGLLKIGDFGVSKISNQDGSMASTIVGTPHYLSPEMCDNKPYGRKSDIWALGCMLVELCTLQKAFDSSSISKIILSIMGGKYTPLPDSYGKELGGLVADLLQVDPSTRPSVSQILQKPYVKHYVQRYLRWAAVMPDAQFEVILLGLQGSQLERPHHPPPRRHHVRAGPGGDGADGVPLVERSSASASAAYGGAAGMAAAAALLRAELGGGGGAGPGGGGAAHAHGRGEEAGQQQHGERHHTPDDRHRRRRHHHEQQDGGQQGAPQLRHHHRRHGAGAGEEGPPLQPRRQRRHSLDCSYESGSWRSAHAPHGAAAAAAAIPDAPPAAVTASLARAAAAAARRPSPSPSAPLPRADVGGGTGAGAGTGVGIAGMGPREEQLEGLRRLRTLRSRLRVSTDGSGSCGGGPSRVYSLTLSVDSNTSAATPRASGATLR